MKTDTLYYAPSTFSREEDDPLHARTSSRTDVDTRLEEMEVRAGLCTALSDMSASMRALLGLMGRHNCITVLPDASFPAYERIMGRIGTAVEQSVVMVERSRALDRRMTLDRLPAKGARRQ